MTACMAMENNELVITLDGVELGDAGRAANVELALLRKLSHLRTSKGLVYGSRIEFRRPRSTMKDYEAAKDVLRGFCLWGQS